ncbi:MAG: 6-phosphofructokinase [Bacteroidales bacterium]|jgi:6-phosphofructokinase 1|nr:6-phosphofructokinase [Bacteroidales bacterium]
MQKSIVILTGGGPAPGMNTVVGSITKTFISNGYRVLGLHGGYKGLFSPNPNYVELDFFKADDIFNRGGSYLVMSRFKPTQEDFDKNFNLKFFQDNNIELLVTIGGDDTASTANRIAKFLKEKNFPISNIHVPKTIDNDLPLPQNIPTFGYQSAKGEGSRIAATVYEDARTSHNWFVISAMGRSAGHLALAIGYTNHFPMIVIPEMFNKSDISVEKILNMAVSAIIKRKILGIDYGAIIISEGVFEGFSPEELKNYGVRFSYDEHGHPELGKISKAQMFNDILDVKLNQLGLKVKIRPVEIGYEIRCITPHAYDLVYCTELGMGVYKLFKQGITGCMVYLDLNGNIKSLYLKDMQDPATGKIPPRGVNIHQDKVNMIFEYIMHYITPADYEAAKKYVPDPETYDFKKILNW